MSTIIAVLCVLIASLLGHISKIHKQNKILTHDLYLSRLKDVVKETRNAEGNPR